MTDPFGRARATTPEPGAQRPPGAGVVAGIPALPVEYSNRAVKSALNGLDDPLLGNRGRGMPTSPPPKPPRMFDPTRPSPEGEGPGLSVVREVPAQAAASDGSLVGFVDRLQYRNEVEAKENGPVVSMISARAQFDLTSGETVIPVKVFLRAATESEEFSPVTGRPNSPRPRASPDLVRKVGQAYVEACNRNLNGWYTLRIAGPPGPSWVGRDLPITVRVTEVSSLDAADFEVAVHSGDGRESARGLVRGQPDGRPATRGVVDLYQTVNERTLVHEGAHMALGAPDEYEERDLPSPEYRLWNSASRQRHGDLSLMSDDQPAWFAPMDPWTTLHERHFAFVPAFVSHALQHSGKPGYQATLHELSRPSGAKLHLDFFTGYSTGSKQAESSFGLDAQYKVDRAARWRAALGLRLGARYAGDTGNEAPTIVAGARATGIHRFNVSRRAHLTAEGFAQADGTWNLANGAPGLDAEVGGGTHVTFEGLPLTAGFEAAHAIHLAGDGESRTRLGVTIGLDLD